MWESWGAEAVPRPAGRDGSASSRLGSSRGRAPHRARRSRRRGIPASGDLLDPSVGRGGAGGGRYPVGHSEGRRRPRQLGHRTVRRCTSVTARRSPTERLTLSSRQGRPRCPRSRRAARREADAVAVTTCWRRCSRRSPRSGSRRPPRLPEHNLPAHHHLTAPTIVLDGDAGERQKCKVTPG